MNHPSHLASSLAAPARVRYLRKRPWSGFLYSTDSGLPLGPFEAEVERAEVTQ